ncbi:GGDEF domain-containing protein [Tepidicella xavieri]|uniref:diguanylate cyclase n=1 Tax=Tepidicella xavieri TaxID=360241 RepID=A0A4R6UIQ0_9BURK|nr:GGDEF domain-containing protein [Tepidicella xavieri]TDQ44895.1 diguanylate cyclase (GGDEF)-like protein [Tepidicella xavieri]
MTVAAKTSSRPPVAARRDWLAALKEDYALAVLTLGGLLAILWLAPFAVYRALTHNWVAAVADTLLSLVLGGAAIHAWRTGDTRWPGWIMALSIVGGIWAIGYSAEFAALFWVYPGVLMMFFLVPAWAAATLGAAAIAGAAILSWNELGGTEGLPFFVITNVLTGVFAFLVSQQAHQRISRWQTLSLIDPLTGIGNRRLMEVEFAQPFAGRRAAGALAVLDIDHFKQINDRFGHDAGDAVLRDLAAVVQANLRKTDRFYRFGGEEFVLWLPHGEPATHVAVLERVRQAVREQVRVGEQPVTLSAGMAVHQAPEPWQSCLSRADAALYRAKREGRDRVVWQPAEGAHPPPRQ